MAAPTLPPAPNSIQKGVPLKTVLGEVAINQMAENFSMVYPGFDKAGFAAACLNALEPLSLTQRSKHISKQLKIYLPEVYSEAAAIIEKSLTPPLERTSDNGLAPMFYMPHCDFVAAYGADSVYNANKDPFQVSMDLQYALTKRFTCEFSIRTFLNKDLERTLAVLKVWMKDKDPHVRRLCSEGTRPRLPWASKIDAFVKDPTPVIHILEALKDDPELYVRRSVANHIGDIAKDHLELALDLCESWLKDASKERKWVIRHALRNPFKKGDERAIALRMAAK